MISRSNSSCISESARPFVPSGRLETTNSRPRMRARVSRTTSDSSMTKIRFIRVSAAVRQRACRLADGRMDKERCPLSDLTFHRDEAAMFLHDLMGHRQTQPATFILASEKRIKNMLQVLFGYADAGIANFNLHKIPRGFCSISRDGTRCNADRSTFLHGLDRVQNKVHKYLLHLLSVNPDLGKIFTKIPLNDHVLFFCLGLENPRNVIHYVIDVFGGHVRLRRACEAQKVVNQPANPINFLEREPLKTLTELSILVTLGQELRECADSDERVANL